MAGRLSFVVVLEGLFFIGCCNYLRLCWHGEQRQALGGIDDEDEGIPPNLM
jgi:hypothetical protein